MLSIVVKDTPLDLLPDTAVDIQSECPIFDRERIDRLYTFPFTLLPTATNLSVLGPFNRTDNSAPLKIPAQLYLHGSLYESGVLKLVSPGYDRAEWVFQGTSLDYRNRMERLRLHELSMPINVAEQYCPDVLYSCLYPTDSLVTIFFIIQVGDNIYEANIPDLESLVDAINADFPGLAEVYTLSDFSDIYTPPTNFDYALLLFKRPACAEVIINEAVPEPEPELYFQFTLVGDVTYYERQRIAAAWELYLSSQLLSPTAAAFPIIKAENLYDKKNPGWLGYANYYTPAGNYYDPTATTPTDNTLTWPHTLLPQPRLPNVLAAIAAAISATGGWRGKIVDNDELQTLLILGLRPLDLAVYDWDEQVVNVLQPSFNLAECLPNTTALDLVSRVATTLLSYIWADGTTLHITPVADKLRQPPRDWTQYIDPRHTGRTEPISGYSLDFDRQGDDTDVPGQLQRIDGGVEAAEYIATAYTLHEIDEADPIANTRRWRVPFHNLQGYSAPFAVKADTSVRLFFDRGLQPDSEDDTYPLASHRALRYDGDSVGSYSLDWPTATGLLARWWAAYISASTRNHTYTFTMRLPLQELLLLRRWRYAVVSFYTERGQFTGIIQSIRVQVGTQGISPAEVTFLKL